MQDQMRHMMLHKVQNSVGVPYMNVPHTISQAYIASTYNTIPHMLLVFHIHGKRIHPYHPSLKRGGLETTFPLTFVEQR